MGHQSLRGNQFSNLRNLSPAAQTTSSQMCISSSASISSSACNCINRCSRRCNSWSMSQSRFMWVWSKYGYSAIVASVSFAMSPISWCILLRSSARLWARSVRIVSFSSCSSLGVGIRRGSATLDQLAVCSIRGREPIWLLSDYCIWCVWVSTWFNLQCKQSRG